MEKEEILDIIEDKISTAEKKHKSRQKNEIMYSPMKMTEALKNMGESYTKKDAVLYYSGVLLIAVILGLFFELKPLYLVIVGIVYVLFVPQIIFNQKKQAYELRRFNDINAYMSQLAQSFTSTSNILDSLYETAATFSSGKMHDTLMDAISIVEETVDVEEAVSKAFKRIEKDYKCEKLLNFHEFLLIAQKRGGDCETEFVILEKVRIAWEKAVEKYRKDLVSIRNTSTVLYGLMLVLCIVIMNAFTSDLSIIHMEFIQIVNTVLLSFLIIIFVLLDTRINGSLLKDPKFMSKETADIYFEKMQSANSEKNKKKYMAYTVIVSVVVAALFFMNPSPVAAAVGLMAIVIVVNLQKILLSLTVSTLKNEILKAFPNWLFDVTLLMQRESIDSAILISSTYAPPVLQAELHRICNLIRRNEIRDAYMSFLRDFDILHIETSMRKLYSLSIGTSTKSEVMHFIIENNMEILTDAEKKAIEMKADTSSLYQFLPFLITSGAMLMYCIAILMVSLSHVLQMLE